MFIDLIRGGTTPWVARSGAQQGATIGPEFMDANGMPMQNAVGQTGYNTFCQFAPTTIRPNNYVCRWTGGDAGTSVLLPQGCTLISGSQTGANGRFVFSIPASPIPAALFNCGVLTISTSPPTNYVTNISIIYSDDEADWLIGKIFGKKLLSRIAQGKIGVIRHLNTQNDANVRNQITTWATRKPQSYVLQGPNEMRASLCATPTGSPMTVTTSGAVLGLGITSMSWSGSVVTVTTASPHGLVTGTVLKIPIQNVVPINYNTAGNSSSLSTGADCTITGASTFTFPLTSNPGAVSTPGTCNINCYDFALTWNDPVYGSGAVTDKQTVIVKFPANAGGAQSVIGFSGGTNITWPNHPFTGGEIIGLRILGNSTTNLWQGVRYKVLVAGLVAGTSFRMALADDVTNTPINYGTVQGGTITAARMPTLNLNSGGAAAIGDISGTILLSTDLPSATTGATGVFPCWGSMVYDADLGEWLKLGASAPGSNGLFNGISIELITQLAIQSQSHPWIVGCMMTLDPMTNFYPQLGAYLKSVQPSWMVPRIEGTNETWNTGNPSSQYAINKAWSHWGVQYGMRDWYGKIISTLGQAVFTAYGGVTVGGAAGSQYQVICGVQEVFGNSLPNSVIDVKPRLESTQYVAQAASPQSGYLKAAASRWATHVGPANYFIPTQYGTGTETTNAVTYAAHAAKITSGSISAGTLTVVSSNFALAGGTIVAGATIVDRYGQVPAGVTILAYGTGGTTGTGGTGTYALSNSSFSVIAPAIFYTQDSTAVGLLQAYVDTLTDGSGAQSLPALLIITQNYFTTAQTYTNDAGNKIKVTFYEGGYSPDYTGSNQVNFFRDGSKFVADVGIAINGGTLASTTVIAGNYPDLVSAGGEFPSCFELSGTNVDWPVLDPDLYATDPPQWTAIVAFNQ